MDTIPHELKRSQLETSKLLLNQDRVGLGLNPGEDMDVCKCIVPLWHGGTLNSRRVASRVVGGSGRVVGGT
ncbi:hypothetical protein TNCV_2729981 [Trichonephila clavipes]|nr:hypothetical protein TNCV_2729981 [Trichonephila clavipes]